MIWLYALRDYAKENKLNNCLRQAFTDWCAGIYMRELNKDICNDFKPHIQLNSYVEYLATLNLKTDYGLIVEFLKITQFDKYPGRLDRVAEDYITKHCTPIEITKIAKYGNNQ